MSSFEELTVDGSQMKMYIGAPSEGGPHPAMIVMCHGAGIDGFTEDRVDQLAQAGYIAVAPDMFHRIPDITDGAEKRENMSDVEIANDIQVAEDYLLGRSDVDKARIGIIGHCMGGRMSFQGAIESSVIKACVVFYGGNMMKTWGRDIPKTPFERLSEISCPVIGFFGLDDDNPSPADVDQIEHALKNLEIDCEFHRYENAGHAFQNFLNRDKFRKDPNADAWTRTLEFLSDKLG